MSGFTPLSPEDLEAFDVEPLEWVIDKVIPLGSLTLFDGREKSGKGLVSIDAAVSVATGESFLDYTVFPGPAIYAFGEENIREVRTRTFARLGWRRDVEFYVLPLNGQTQDRFSLQDPESLQLLDAMIVQYDPKLVILDTMREFHMLAEDSSDDMGPLLRPLRQIAHNRNVAICLNHHQNKANTSRGSTAIRAAVDQSISLIRTDGANTDTLPDPNAMPKGVITIDGRFGPRLVLNVELGCDMRWQVVNAPSLSMDAPKRDIVLEYIRQATEPITAEDVANATGINLKTTQNVISTLLGEEAPPIKSIGVARKGSPRRFCSIESLPDSGNHGNDMGTTIVPENRSHGGGYRVGNDFPGNDSPRQVTIERSDRGEAA